jgi:NAD(P)-dependent dehydrogenase (short-subunit alcohol dehydrogenase family)
LHPWGIEVIAIEPGSIATPIWDKAQVDIDAMKEGVDPEAERLYGEQLVRMEEVTRETAERGIPAVEVAKVIRRALEARRPKTRYVVGRDAKMMRTVERAIPDRAFDRLMRGQMKLPEEAPPAK